MPLDVAVRPFDTCLGVDETNSLTTNDGASPSHSFVRGDLSNLQSMSLMPSAQESRCDDVYNSTPRSLMAQRMLGSTFASGAKSDDRSVTIGVSLEAGVRAKTKRPLGGNAAIGTYWGMDWGENGVSGHVAGNAGVEGIAGVWTAWGGVNGSADEEVEGYEGDGGPLCNAGYNPRVGFEAGCGLPMRGEFSVGEKGFTIGAADPRWIVRRRLKSAIRQIRRLTNGRFDAALNWARILTNVPVPYYEVVYNGPEFKPFAVWLHSNIDVVNGWYDDFKRATADDRLWLHKQYLGSSFELIAALAILVNRLQRTTTLKSHSSASPELIQSASNSR